MKVHKSGQHFDEPLLWQSYLRDDGCCHCGQVDEKYHDCTKTIYTYLSIDRYIHIYSMNIQKVSAKANSELLLNNLNTEIQILSRL